MAQLDYQMKLDDASAVTSLMSPSDYRLKSASEYLMCHIYVDGSCLENQNVDEETPAGWELLCYRLSGLGRGNGEIFHEFNGRVITDPDKSKFIGAEVGSNNTAELTAFAEALRWALSEGGDSEIVIKTDSQYAGNQATGNWKAKANRGGCSRSSTLE